MQQENKEIYEVIDYWKENSLFKDRGIIWTEEPIWSNENLHRFRATYIEKPDTSANTFYNKLEMQLAGEGELVYKLVIEMLFLYYLVPKATLYETKINNIQMVANWGNIEIDLDQPIFNALKEGLIFTGMGYNSQINFELTFIHHLAERIKRYTEKERKAILQSPTKLKKEFQIAREPIDRKVQMYNILLHLLIPNYFELIASWTDKDKIIKTFNYLIEDESLTDRDAKIYIIKEKLKEDYEDEEINFYLTEEIRELWKPEEKKKHYFWQNCHPNEHKQKEGIIRQAYKDGARRKQHSAYTKVDQGDEVIFFEIAPVQAITAFGKVRKIEHEQGNKTIYYDVTEVVEPIPWEEIASQPELASSSVVQANNHGASLFELKEQHYNTLYNWYKEDVTDEATEEAKEGANLERIDFTQSLQPKDFDLIFENEDILFNQITTALKKGDHIIFTGPPGTGKSKLAKLICQAYNVDAKMVTASSNWSTYDTIGGYRPDRSGELYFDPGIFLEAVKDSRTNSQKNEWIIVDELNRADIDKAFGSLFSVLTGDTVTLPFEANNGKKIEIALEEKETQLEEHRYIISKDWRMIATINTVDKASLFEMSYAFMRRFAFIPVSIPKTINVMLIKRYLDVWKMANYPYPEELTKLWKLINEYRKIGPAIIADIAKYTSYEGDFTSAIILYVLPQFEGIANHRIEQFVQSLSQWPDLFPDISPILDFVADFFQQGDF